MPSISPWATATIPLFSPVPSAGAVTSTPLTFRHKPSNQPQKNLKEWGCPENYTLIHASHHLVKDYVKEPIKAGMFNLGYLPGGDKRITTMRETTMPAIEAAIDLLAPDGILNIAVYPGHEEGEAEGKMICDYLSGISRHKVCATLVKIINSPTSPFFIMVETKPPKN